MIVYELGVEDLADTRFAMSPIAETVFSLWALTDPSRHAIHLPWRRTVLAALTPLDARQLFSLVGPSRALPDFLTPRPAAYAPTLHDELARVRSTPPDQVRRDVLAAHAPDRVPRSLRAAESGGDTTVAALRDALCDLLQRYWDLALAASWPQIRLVLEADMTHRARQLATGGARLLFADMHPNLRWHDGALHIDKMIGHHRVSAAGRGLLLVPSVFAYKPVPPISAQDPPSLAYPCRGVATLWAVPREPGSDALAKLLGPARAGLLRLLAEPTSTTELARRLAVTPSAVSQHLQVMHANNLLDRARAGRQVLYRRSVLGEQLSGASNTSSGHE